MIVLRRLATALPVIAGVIVVTFLLTRALPGDPAVYFAGPAATQQAIDEIRHQLGFDRSLPVQFVDYIERLAHGDLGTSLTTGQPVMTELLTRLPASAELTLLALLLSVAIAVPLGIAAAMRPGSLGRPCLPHRHHRRRVAADLLHRSAAGLRVLLPDGSGARAARPARRLRIAAAAAYRVLSDRQPAGRRFRHLSRGAGATDPAGGDDGDLFAGAAGAHHPRRRCWRRSAASSSAPRGPAACRAAGSSVVYAFRNAVLPVITTLGMVFSFLLGANVLVEKVFAWPGIGSYAVDALIASDYAPVQGFVLAMALLYVLLNLVIDLVYGLRRSARAARSMTATLRHAGYVLGENPVTAFAFALFFLFALCAVLGPALAPYTIRSPATPRRR